MIDSKLDIMEYEKILFPRLVLSCFWTVVLHIFPLSLYIFASNFDLVHPLDWVTNSTLLVFKLKTWFSLVPLQTLVFALAYVSSLELKQPPPLITSRFRHLISFFTNLNVLKWGLHMLLGIVLPWTYLKLNDVSFSTPCQDYPKNLCVDEKSVFIAMCCIWTAVYYFIRFDLLKEKHLEFPIIRQLRFLQIRSKFPEMFENCFKLSMIPVFYYLPFYLLYGRQFNSLFEFFVSTELSRTVPSILNIFLLFKAWLMSTIYISQVETLRLMMHIHFTERNSFALVKQPNLNEVLLPTAIREQNIPIIQYLACYDLYILSFSQKSIRWQVFTLSQPGGHPHTWNAIMHESINLIEKFICEVEEIYKVPEPATPKPPVPKHFHHRRVDFRYEETIPVTYSTSSNSKLRRLIDRPEKFVIQKDQQESPVDSILGKLDSYWNVICKNSVINYVFGTKPDAEIRFLISNSQPLIWIIQSISELAANALLEDQFGIVQKDLPLIVNTLLRLKNSLEKTGNIQKKFHKQDYDLCMKASLKSAVKRSLYRIAIAYSDYLTDLPLPSENLNAMRNFVNFKES